MRTTIKDSVLFLTICGIIIGITSCTDDEPDRSQEILFSYCTPNLEPTCPVGKRLEIIVSGTVDSPGYLWAALQKMGQVVAYGPGRYVRAGDFEAYPVIIDMAGLDLEPEYSYDLVVYQSSDLAGVGDPSSRRVVGGPFKQSFTEQEVASFSSLGPTGDAVKTSPHFDDTITYCLVTGLPVVLRLLPIDDDSLKWELFPISCSTAVIPDSRWGWFQYGVPQSAGVLSDSGGIFYPLHKTNPLKRYYIEAVLKSDTTINTRMYFEVEYPIDVGLELGKSSNWIDTLVCEFADSIGFMPQLLKAQIRQEAGANFDTMAYRYEPRYDWQYISVGANGGSYQLTNQPYCWYRLWTLFENGHDTLYSGDLLEDPDYWRGRNTYPFVVDTNHNLHYGVWEYLNYQDSNACIWRCVNRPTCAAYAEDTIGQCPPYWIDFTAQTPIAASYGLLQLMWPSTIYGAVRWNDNKAGSPYLLFNPELNLRLAARKLRYEFINHWDYTYAKYFMAVDSALSEYNNSALYISDVKQWVSGYNVVEE